MVDRNTNRKRLLIVAHACHPHTHMEARLGWRRAIEAVKSYDATVFHGSEHDSAELTELARAESTDDRVPNFVSVKCPIHNCLSGIEALYWVGYRAWQRKALRKALQMHAEQPFDLVHQVSFCGYREPGQWWKLEVPFVWGPVGGTSNFPVAYCNQLDWRSALRERLRNTLNRRQLLTSKRVKQAAENAAVRIAASVSAQQALQHATGQKFLCQLETGVDLPAILPIKSPSQDRPLRLLWSGRLRAWKALPLLLKALAQLPATIDFQLRVMGVGSCERAWAAEAARLGLADRVEWIGWPSYAESMGQYAWADAFAFTSLRDTSGTGLLESLAMGTPIIGLDHQGAHDIMTEDCALKVSVSSPDETIAGFRDAILRFACDAELRQRLLKGASTRAANYTWGQLALVIEQAYQQALGSASTRNAVTGPVAKPVVTSRSEKSVHVSRSLTNSGQGAL